MISGEIRERGLKEARKALQDFRQAISQGRKEPMEKMADMAIEIIRKRTTAGKDVNGKAFEPYSPAYAKKKGTSFVDLELIGKMLNAIARQAWAKKARVFVKAGIEYVKAIVHNAGGRSGRGTGFAMPEREFMGVEKEEEQVCDVGRKWWYDFARKLGLLK